MGRVLVKAPAAPPAGGGGVGGIASNLLGELMPKVKTGAGGVAAGAGGALQFLTSLADAGANQQDLLSGASTAGGLGLATGSALGSAVDRFDPSNRSGKRMYDTMNPDPAIAARNQWERDRSSAERAARDAMGRKEKWSSGSHGPSGLEVFGAPIHSPEARKTRAERRDLQTGANQLHLDSDFGTGELGRLGTRDPARPLTGRFYLPEGGFAPNMFSSSYPESAHFRNLMSNQTGALAPPTPSQLASYNMPPAPPTNNDHDMSSVAENSMGGDIDVSHSGEAELVDDPAAVMGAGGASTLADYDLNEISLLNPQNKDPLNTGNPTFATGEPMDMAFRLLKRRRDV